MREDLVPTRALDRRRFMTGGMAAGLGTLAVGAAATVRPAPAAAADPPPEGVVTATNIRDFGATGDGVSDDTAAIQRAIDACRGRGGGLVYIPSGRYAISGIKLSNGIDLLGENHNTAVLVFSATSGNAIELGPNAGFNRLANFQIFYDRETRSGAAIHLTRTFTVDIDGVFVHGGSPDRINAYDGIVADECTATFIRNFNVYYCQNDGIRISGPGGNDTFLTTGVVNLGQTRSGAAIRLRDYRNGAVNITDAEILLGRTQCWRTGRTTCAFRTRTSTRAQTASISGAATSSRAPAAGSPIGPAPASR